MPLRFEQELVESAVTLHLTSGRVPALQATRFHRERENLYRVSDPDERNDAFFKLHLEWFREWALDKQLTGPVHELSLLETLDLLAFRSARSKREEGAELYVNDAGKKHGVVALRPLRFRDAKDLNCFLRHELWHICDMVDPTFGYAPGIRGQLSPAQQRLARERYRVLWDVTIDGRITKSRNAGQATKEERRAEFDAAFPFWSSDKRDALFISLWTEAHPTHAMLEDHVRDPRDLQNTKGPVPGSPCPLCTFPTFDWATAGELSNGTVAAILTEFPYWTSDQGACSRCADIYRLVSLEHERQACAPSAA